MRALEIGDGLAGGRGAGGVHDEDDVFLPGVTLYGAGLLGDVVVIV